MVNANEFFAFLGIIIISGAISKGGQNLFEKESSRLKDGAFCVTPACDLSPYMAMCHFDDIKTYFPQAFADFIKSDPKLPNHDPWYMLSAFINAFNKNRAKTVA